MKIPPQFFIILHPKYTLNENGSNLTRLQLNFTCKSRRANQSKEKEQGICIEEGKLYQILRGDWENSGW